MVPGPAGKMSAPASALYNNQKFNYILSPLTKRGYNACVFEETSLAVKNSNVLQRVVEPNINGRFVDPWC